MKKLLLITIGIIVSINVSYANISKSKILTTKTNSTRVKEVEYTFKGGVEFMKNGNLEETDFSEEEKEAIRVLKSAYKKIEYKINNIKVNGDRAVLNATIKVPDLKGVHTETKRKIEENVENYINLSDERKAKFINDLFEEVVNKRTQSKNLKYIQKTLDVNYVYKNGYWNIEKNREWNDLFNFNMESF